MTSRGSDEGGDYFNILTHHGTACPTLPQELWDAEHDHCRSHTLSSFFLLNQQCSTVPCSSPSHRSDGTPVTASAPFRRKSQNASGLSQPPGKRHEIPTTAKESPLSQPPSPASVAFAALV